MAPRKDQLQILRRDAAFSAALHAASPRTGEPSAQEVGSPGAHIDAQIGISGLQEDLRPPPLAPSEPPVPPSRSSSPAVSQGSDEAAGTGRGIPVCVALSLSAAQALRAEAWASAAGCSVPFLMRQVAQSMRKHLVEAAGVEPLGRIVEARTGRRCHPASVTLTLPEALVHDLRARLDPLGVLGLGRAIGPAFRQRFSSAFDEACARAGF